MEKLKEFLSIKIDDGNGNGYGTGNGTGTGYGYGYGNGNGDGYGYGDGDGYGYGDGYGNGDGYGYGNGYGYGLTSLNNHKIYLIDSVQTIIKSIKNNVAKGFIVNNDLTLTPCFIVKSENQFSHGSTLQKALDSLQEKLLSSLPIEKRIENFKENFKNELKKYKAIDFYKWHFLLTGSCDLGREAFVKNRNIDLDNDKFTVFDFIKLVENSYGSNIIKQLKESYNI